MDSKRRTRDSFTILSTLAILVLVLFIVWSGGWTNIFILTLRIKKICIFIMVSVCSSIATLAFQGIVNSRFLTPSILGVEAYYRLLQTILLFFVIRFFSSSINPEWQFLMVTGLMVVSFFLLSRFSWKKISFDLHTVLLIGLVISMLFNSIASFFQVLMDPNEYDQLQMRLFPTFQNVSNSVLILATFIALPVVISLWRKRRLLEVLALGPEQAINLGVDADKEVKKVFLQVILLSAIPAVLVGPMIFLGFTAANLAYQLFRTYRMHILFLGASLIGFIALGLSQFIVEQILELQTNASILIEWGGGILFFALLWKERDQL